MATNLLIERICWRIPAFEGTCTLKTLPPASTWQHQYIILNVHHHFVLLFQNHNTLWAWDPLIQNPFSQHFIQEKLAHVAENMGLRLNYKFLNWQGWQTKSCGFHVIAKMLSQLSGHHPHRPFDFERNVEVSFQMITQFLQNHVHTL